jgi:ubiquinone/menaquinone biosynthesis C-methylase UbiE
MGIIHAQETGIKPVRTPVHTDGLITSRYVLTENGELILYIVTGRTFDEIASIYGPYLFKRADKRTYSSLLLNFLRGKKVLDVGMGNSTFVSTLRENGVEAYGLDIELDEKFSSKDHYFKASINDTKLPDQSYDVIFSTVSVMDSYEGNNRTMVESTLRELLRILKPDGTLLFTTEMSNESVRPYFISKDKTIIFFPDDRDLMADFALISPNTKTATTVVVEVRRQNYIDRKIVELSMRPLKQDDVPLLVDGGLLEEMLKSGEYGSRLKFLIRELFTLNLSNREVSIINNAVKKYISVDISEITGEKIARAYKELEMLQRTGQADLRVFTGESGRLYIAALIADAETGNIKERAYKLNGLSMLSSALLGTFTKGYDVDNCIYLTHTVEELRRDFIKRYDRYKLLLDSDKFEEDYRRIEEEVRGERLE